MTAQPAPRPQARFVNAYLVDESHIIGLYRDEQGELHRRSIDAEWVSYHRRSEMPGDLLREVKSIPQVRSVKVEGDWVRISWTSRKWREDMLFDPRSPLVLAKVPHYEGDVHPIKRWLTDQRPPLAKPRRVFLDIETDSWVPFSEKEKMRVLCWALTDEDGNEVASACLDEFTDADERRVLLEYWEAIKPYDQVICWNGSFNRKEGPFDFYVMNARTRRHQIPVNPRCWLWVDYLPLYKRQNMHSAESGELKQSMKLGDICQEEIKQGKEEVPDFVTERFGAEKTKKGLGPIARDLWEEGGEFRALLLRYCLKDSALIPLLDRKKGYIKLVQATCDVCSLFFDQRSLLPSAHGDGFMLRHGLENGFHFATKLYAEQRGEDWDEEDEDQFQGAYNMKPKVFDPAWRKARGMSDGILRNVHVFDFSRMYPSIIVSWNMSIETLAYDVNFNGPLPPNRSRCPLTGTAFRTDVEGILVAAVRAMLAQRVACDELKDSLAAGSPEWLAADALSQAWKVMANEFFGMAGSKTGRFYERAVAEGITRNGEFLIKATLAEVEKRGWHPFYTDTDSGFVVGPTREQFLAFVEWCNKELYPRLTREAGCRENTVKVAYEKEFRSLVFTAGKRYFGSILAAKGTASCACDRVLDNGAKTPGRIDVWKMKCKDCGASFTEETLPPTRGKPTVKGIELKRGDSPRLVRDLQKKMIDMLVGGMGTGAKQTTSLQDFHAVISEARRHVLEDALTIDEVAKSQSVKKLSSYVVKPKKGGGFTLPPSHVQVAQMLVERGEYVGEGSRVEYFITDGSVSPQKVLPAADYDGKNLDRYDFWEDVLYPPVLAILENAFPDHDWGAWKKVRPPKPRGRARALPGQLGLDIPTPTSAPSIKAPAPIRAGDDIRELHIAYAGEHQELHLARLMLAVLAHAGDDVLHVQWDGAEFSHRATYRVDFVSLADDPRVRAFTSRWDVRFAA